MIRCVGGDVAPDAVALVLPHEHVLHRIATSVASNAAPVRCEDLRELRVSPAALDGQNLVLEKEDEAFRELEALQALAGPGQAPVVVDVTVSIEGRDEFMEKRGRLAEKLGVHIVTVATCDYVAAAATFPLGLSSLEKSERLANVLETELVFGFGAADRTTAVRWGPGAIYQQVHATSATLSPDDSVVVHAIALTQQRTKAPVYLSFSLAVVDSSMRRLQHQQLVRNWLLALLAHGADSSKLVVCHADQWCEDDADEASYSFLHSLLQLGVRLLFSMIGLAAVSDAVVINPRLGGIPDRSTVLSPAVPEPPRDSSIARCIAQLIHDKDANVRQLLLSTNVQQRVQYVRYGGGGYAFLTSHFRERLARYGVTDRHWEQLVRMNPVELLSWYTAPAAAAPRKEFLRCSICNRDFEPVVGEYFTKFAFIYCGTKCLRKHSRQGFAQLPLSSG
jgi:predicted metal-dependent phosphotriesterase family hydrolase